MKLLVIEDDRVTRDYLVKGLREHGHTVDCAANGVDGLHLATSERYDLLVLDRMLPKLDGLAVLAALRSSGNQAPVIILSALSDVDERIRGAAGWRGRLPGQAVFICRTPAADRQSAGSCAVNRRPGYRVGAGKPDPGSGWQAP